MAAAAADNPRSKKGRMRDMRGSDGGAQYPRYMTKTTAPRRVSDVSASFQPGESVDRLLCRLESRKVRKMRMAEKACARYGLPATVSRSLRPTGQRSDIDCAVCL